jgi:hypothetical protein
MKFWIALQVLDILNAACRKIVENVHFFSALQQFLGEMGAHKTSPTRD